MYAIRFTLLIMGFNLLRADPSWPKETAFLCPVSPVICVINVGAVLVHRDS